ncbi:unnamed protein product [Rotaria sordida]|uniref:Mid2 domain-containing protein n=1 Tax=Rotaria sordida TaxID=392033 RepID=A0A814HA61_9BILA|nr:unnamed protein product [Rotaria sordida]CAF1008036.1 unnamed protein product [Rotaria sordida]CAF1009014.1 unnamed protein product [Rotaria sordida]
MSTRLSIIIVLTIVQLHYALTRSASINSGDYHILKILMNQSRINVSSNQNDILPKLNDQLLNIDQCKEDDSKQAAVRNSLSTLTYLSEQYETQFDSTATSIDFKPADTSYSNTNLPLNTIDTTSLEAQSIAGQQTMAKTNSPINIQSTIPISTITSVEMTNSYDTIATTNTTILFNTATTTTITATTTTAVTATTTTTTTAVTATIATTTEITATTTEITATTNSNITLDDRQTTTESITKSKNNLPLILGLTLGLALPLCLGIIGGLVYYYKVYRPKHSSDFWNFAANGIFSVAPSK